jgi:hypothetical protein
VYEAMIDIATLRLIAAVLLVFSVLLIYRLNFHDNEAEDTFELKEEILLQSVVELVGNLVTIGIPMVTVVLLLLPTAVCRTA